MKLKINDVELEMTTDEFNEITDGLTHILSAITWIGGLFKSGNNVEDGDE
jgi:hypothetical protein